MFATPSPWLATLTVKPVPSALLACPPTEAVSDGWNGRPWQPPTWKGEDTGGARAFGALTGCR